MHVKTDCHSRESPETASGPELVALRDDRLPETLGLLSGGSCG